MNDTASWITFGKDRYHQRHEMAKWCKECIRPGDWSYDTPKTWEGMDGKIWIMHSMFRKTTYAFKEVKHLTLFVLRWSI